MKLIPVQKWFLFGQYNFIGSAANSPKEAATTVNANMLTGITGGNDSVMMHLDPAKNINADRFEEKMKENIKLAADSGFTIPALCTDNGATNVKSIRRLCSSRRTNKHNKGKKLCLRSHELFFERNGKKIHTLQCMVHLIKFIRNNICRKNNILHFPEFKLNDNFVLEAGFFDIK